MSGIDRRQFLAAAPLATLAAGSARGENPTNPLKFRLGMVTYNVAATWDVSTILKVCKATGISPVELRTTHKHHVEPSLTKEQRAEIRKRFADSGVEIWGCGTICEFHSPNQAEVRKQIETCKRFIELASDIGGKGVKVRPNGLPKGVETAKTLEQIGKALIPCGKAAADAGVEIWVEVHGAGTAHPPHMKTIMEHADHPKVGVTWNSNPTDIKNGSVAEYFHLLAPWIRSCHINELYRYAAGKYPYRELFSLLRGIGYDRVTLVEIGRSWPDADAGTEMLRYYKALWQELCGGSADVKKEEQLNVPPKGFTALFNGKDLTGWQSVITMKERKTLTKEQLDKKLASDNAKNLKHWKVKDGVIEYDGKADSLQTVKDYGDFELLCDWKIAEEGDSGIYLRGQPQVQIWDSDKTPGARGKDVSSGSGGLWNNPEELGKRPLRKADRPVGEWNRFRIIVKNDKVTVYLNGELVVDKQPLLNYWFSGQPVPKTGPVELQHHGDPLWFRNIFIKELKD